MIWMGSPSVPRLPLDPYAMICPLLPKMGTALPRELPCTDATTEGRSSMKPMYCAMPAAMAMLDKMPRIVMIGLPPAYKQDASHCHNGHFFA